MMNTAEQFKNRERKQRPEDMLTDLLCSLSRQTNKTSRAEGLAGNLLSENGSLDPAGYKELHGKDVLEADADFIRRCELEFSGAGNSKTREFYRNHYGTQTEDDIIATWKKNHSREKGALMEMAVTILLSQKLGGDFLVVRTAPYDDYRNGVDNLILDRVTGEVIGAFDEVHDAGGGRRTEEKKSKIREIAKKGGAKIRYGLRLAGEKIARASLEEVPVFYLGLEEPELKELMQGLAENNPEKTDAIFEKLIGSLQTQFVDVANHATSPGFRARLLSFGKSLSRVINTQQRAA